MVPDTTVSNLAPASARDFQEILEARSLSTMRELPSGCALLWTGLVCEMQQLQVTTLRYRMQAPTPETLSRVLACSEADVARCFEPLVEAGFLTREDDGGLTCPLLVRQAERRRQDELRKQQRVEVRAAREAEFLAAQRADAGETAEPEPSNVVYLFGGKSA